MYVGSDPKHLATDVAVCTLMFAFGSKGSVGSQLPECGPTIPEPSRLLLCPYNSWAVWYMATLKEILTRRPVSATIRLTVPAGPSRPGARLNLMAFCKDFNARTQKHKPDTPMSVTITALKKAAGIEGGSGRPSHVVASSVTLKHVFDIAKVRFPIQPVEPAGRVRFLITMIGTANSMGIKVVKELE
uniref:Large ribosomal subunit protein uL11 C-terminal domain-containing protein n=1 Tax=Kalanchoe fedtschenkoi TaxID=63787 RepID=A0A7N1A2V6_KALFE